MTFPTTSRRRFLEASLAAGAGALMAPGARDYTNVVMIMTDDQGQWALGCYGNPEIKTPNLDRLAAEGTRFQRAFVTTPVCSPSRATFLTGTIPSQHGIRDWINQENIGAQARTFLDNIPALPEMLAPLGHTCAISGKWHLGDSLKRQKGFHQWFVLPTGGSRYQDPELIWQGQVRKYPGYITEILTNQALDFIDQNRDKPFFVFVGYNAPHTPYEGHPQRYLDLYKNCAFKSIPDEGVHPRQNAGLRGHLGNRESLSRYFAAVSAVDENVGRILAELDRHRLRQRTLVVFTSDNGFNCGHHGVWGKGNGTVPHNMYEGSILTPLIFCQPGRVRKGEVREEMVSAYDFLPSVLEHLGAPPPPNREKLPGRSYAPLLRGKKTRWENVVFGEYDEVRMIRTEEFKYVHRMKQDAPNELWDLKNDPRETRNLAAEPAHAARVVELRERLDQWFGRYGKPC